MIKCGTRDSIWIPKVDRGCGEALEVGRIAIGHDLSSVLAERLHHLPRLLICGSPRPFSLKIHISIMKLHDRT